MGCCDLLSTAQSSNPLDPMHQSPETSRWLACYAQQIPPEHRTVDVNMKPLTGGCGQGVPDRLSLGQVPTVNKSDLIMPDPQNRWKRFRGEVSWGRGACTEGIRGELRSYNVRCNKVSKSSDPENAFGFGEDVSILRICFETNLILCIQSCFY